MHADDYYLDTNGELDDPVEPEPDPEDENRGYGEDYFAEPDEEEDYWSADYDYWESS